MNLNFAFNLFAIAGLLLQNPGPTLKDAEKLQSEFDTNIRPILEEHCFDCHSGTEASAGLNLEPYQKLIEVLEDDRKWASISEQIESGNMPPQDAGKLSTNQKKQVSQWVKNTFDLVNCKNAFPGNVTIRKLNRTEYRNSVRDLLGVDYELADDFPGDDIGDGFDNVADVLSLPPVLMEKYLDAAETISQLAIVDPNTVNLSFGGASFEPARNNNSITDGVLSFYSEDTASKSIVFQMPGVYAFVVKAYGDPANGEYPEMSVLMDGKRVKTVEVKARKRKPSWHGFRLFIPSKGKRNIQIRFENDYYKSNAFIREDRNLHIVAAVVRGPGRPESDLAYMQFESHTDSEAGKFIADFLPRVFRKPVDENRLGRFRKFYVDARSGGDSFHTALQKVVQATLVSSDFLYKIEKPIASGSIRALDDFERATAISYFLWSSTPDDQLLELATQQQLSNTQIWNKQVKRLLEHEKSKALIDNFVSQWLNLRLLSDIQPDSQAFPGVDRDLLVAMQTETSMVVEEILRRDGSLLELLDTDFTYLNQRLANHYKIPAPIGDTFVRVELDNNQRRGILTHASFLTLTSNPTRTSPVKRGKWVMENILGLEPPPPLPDVSPLDETKQVHGTLRERMEQHRADPACASCHVKMDAIGFTFENYDGVGRFRLLEDGQEIDVSSQLPDGVVLRGAGSLQNEIATTYRNQFVRCFTEKLLTYAIGRGIKYYDRCAVNKIMKRAEEANYRISEFIMAVAESEPFLKRGINSKVFFE